MSNFFLENSNNSNDIDSLNDMGDLSRMAYQNKSSDIPLRNKSMTDRFETDTFINHKESFEQNNSRINGLNDEIRELKTQLKEIYKKDEQISSLKNELNDKISEIENLKIIENNYRISIDENRSLKNELDLLRIQLSDNEKITNENLRLKKKIVELVKNNKKDLNSDRNNIEIEDLDINENTNDSTNESTNENMIIVDVPKIKMILSERLKSYHEKHINKLIEDYKLNETEKINESTMKKLLVETIHLN